MTDEEFRGSIRKGLSGEAGQVDGFLQCCTYFQGGYVEVESFRALSRQLAQEEQQYSQSIQKSLDVNRLIYFAIPPNVFVPSAACIREALMSPTGWTRLIIEKPFGHDLASARLMSKQIGELFTEDHIYRIDHYLGKEMVR